MVICRVWTSGLFRHQLFSLAIFTWERLATASTMSSIAMIFLLMVPRNTVLAMSIVMAWLTSELHVVGSLNAYTHKGFAKNRTRDRSTSDLSLVYFLSPFGWNG